MEYSTKEKPISKAVIIWLLLVCALIFLMVMVGGATRLTNSGLSITEWKPIVGMIPPLSDADWQDAFAKYKLIPEYIKENKGMSLAEFQSIFWWEWGHRFLGRIIGIVFFVPFLVLLALKKIPSSLKPKLVVMFILGGLQGAMGWYMVKSGLVDRVDVSQYRLAAHLVLAVLILGYMLWTVLGLMKRPNFILVLSVPRMAVFSGVTLLSLVVLQIILGAFVAGIHAGRIYNTWPLMDGAFIPSGLWTSPSTFLSLFEDHLTTQFDHRMVAYLITIWAVFHALFLNHISDGILRTSAWLMVGVIFLQIVLGIATLLMVVPVSLGVLHQGGALLVFIVVLWHLKLLVRAREG